MARNWSKKMYDLEGAFLQGKPFEENEPRIYLKPPINWSTDEKVSMTGIARDEVLMLDKPLYGLVDAPRRWFLSLFDFLVSIGFRNCSVDKGIFYVVCNKQGEVVFPT